MPCWSRRWSSCNPPPCSPPIGLDTPTESVAGAIAGAGSVTPFLNDISASARETFLSFLTQIRTNPDYLATRLSCLNQSELAALTSFHPALEPIGSPSSRIITGRAAGSRVPTLHLEAPLLVASAIVVLTWAGIRTRGSRPKSAAQSSVFSPSRDTTRYPA